MSEQASSSVSSESQRHLVVRAVLRTDTGLVRSENQDFGTYTTRDEETHCNAGGRLLIVADGMGGHRGGATASRLAAETVKSQYLGSESTDIPTVLRNALTHANARIFSEAQANPDLRGMGTTTSVLAAKGGEGWLAHVGDSRIYMLRDGGIEQLTDDHSLVATMVREGLLTAAEAETHPRRNVLQRSMGVSEEVEVDVRGPIELREGDIFVLCSDGLHGVVKEDEIKEVVAMKMAIEGTADELLRRALSRGAPDNVTVLVARVEGAEEVSEAATVVEKFEDTQKLEPIDSSQFDETVKETAPLPVGAAPLPAVGAPQPGVPPASSRPSDSPKEESRLEVGGTRETAPPSSRSFIKWILVVALVLGAAGAWLFWNHQNSVPAATPSSSKR